jgi:radical SAM superfamily enzyme YgiQ (UPF0313 family)
VRILLISTYELGRQPFGLASPAAWLRREGHTVTAVDVSRTMLPRQAAQEAGLIAFYLPMHTATRLAVRAMDKVRRLNPDAHLCCYGLYAPVNAQFLRQQGVQTILGGEFEQPLLDLARRLEKEGGAGAQREPLISLDRQNFIPPDRTGLPALGGYARLQANGASKRVGYTEASRGCKHLCRHCPIVPVYNGLFRIVQKDVVLEDIRRQVEAGAEHITFGDPDFFNGPGHALAVVEGLNAAHPGLTYDVTIKVEHLLRHADMLPVLKRTGCLFVTSAVESIDDAVLERLAKGHTREDFIAAVRLMRAADLTLAPTFVTFTPWTTRAGYRELLELLLNLDMVDHVAPIQLAIRLLIPAGSRMMELPEVRGIVEPFDAGALVYPWKHPDSAMDRLCRDLQALIKAEDRRRTPRAQVFGRIWGLAHDRPLPENFDLVPRAAVPYLNEPWYC